MSLKIGVSSYSFARHMEQTGASYLDVCDLAKSMGFDGIEFITLQADARIGESVQAVADALYEHCGRIGLPVLAYTVGADFSKDPAAEAQRVKGCVDIAARLHAPLLRHDVARGYPGDDWRTAIQTIAPAVREVTAYASSLHIRTCTENHGFFFQDAHRVEELILAVGHENYGFLVDIGNFACADEESLHGVLTAAKYAFHAHAKDFLIKPATADDPGKGWFRSRQGRYLRGTVPGHGAVPIRACVTALKAAGYAGYLSYEFEGMEENLPALANGLAFLRTVV